MLTRGLEKLWFSGGVKPSDVGFSGIRPTLFLTESLFQYTLWLRALQSIRPVPFFIFPLILGRYTCGLFFKTPPKTKENKIFSIKCPPITLK
jgi:hypothetical protein